MGAFLAIARYLTNGGCANQGISDAPMPPCDNATRNLIRKVNCFYAMSRNIS
jgi:hypothetical protein